MASSVNRDKQLVNSETIHRKITRKTFGKHCQVDTPEDTWLILSADLNLKDPQLLPSSRSQYLTTPLPGQSYSVKCVTQVPKVLHCLSTKG